MNHDEDLDLNAIIKNDGEARALLPAGEYDFIVASYSLKEFQETDQNTGIETPRKKVELSLIIEVDSERYTIKDTLVLKKSWEWKFCQLFKCIGDRKHNEDLRMDWGNIAGKRGRLKLTIENYTNKKKEDKSINRVKEYLEPSETTTMPRPTYTKPVESPKQEVKPQVKEDRFAETINNTWDNF